MSNTALPAYSRFHAIISASPASGLPPRPAPYPQPALTYIHHNAPKRRRIVNNGFKVLPRVLKDASSSNERAASRQRPCNFASKDLLLEELKRSFKSSQTVDFHGSYELVEPNLTHKQRVQSLTVDIWRATGYRFTVKDHPRINNGHKTRFWCSQDEAHRSKSSKLARLPDSASKPRISSAGEALAKARYACKSRLLISSRDSPLTTIITVRLHHHVAHEPYVDVSLPPELARAVYKSFGWPPNGHDTTIMTPSSSATADNLARLADSGADATLLPLGYPQDEDNDGDDHELGDADADPDEDLDEEDDEAMSPAIVTAESVPPPSSLSVRPPASASTLASVPSNVSSATLPSTAPSLTVSAPTSSQLMRGQSSTQDSNSNPTPNSTISFNFDSTQSNIIFNDGPTTLNSSSSATSPNSTTATQLASVPQQQDQSHYHQRMRAHISNIREFCSGLEYQLQFNDYRMLDVLEKEGGPFLRLVQDCLRKEGRLDFNGECS